MKNLIFQWRDCQFMSYSGSVVFIVLQHACIAEHISDFTGAGIEKISFVL
jgi:hypothetical protein